MILLTALPAQAESHPASSQVLVIHSYHSGLSWTDSIMNGIRDAFQASGLEIQLSAEYLDARRYPGTEQARRIRDLVLSKLQDSTPDLVMVSDNAALDFILDQRDRLFADIPIVFCGINDFKPAMISKSRGISGVAEEVSIVETVDLALRLHSGTRGIIVIGRTSVAADKYNRDSVVAALPELPPQLEVTFWDDLPTSELRARLEKLNPGTIVLLNGLITDQSGRQLMYGETTRWICRHSPVPVYSLWDVYLGYGIVGGKLVTGYRQGQLAAELAVRILRGESADLLPVIHGLHANRTMLDYAVLVKFGVALSGLPHDAILINRPESFYQKYKTLVWATAGVVLLLSGLVFLLGVAVIHRRRAMETLSKSEEALRQASLVVESSPVILFRWKAAEGWPVALVSSNVTQFGYTPEELLSGAVPFSAIVHPEDLERVASEVQHYSASGIDQFQQEYRIVTKEGDARWVEDYTIVNRDVEGMIAGYQGTVIDITERKQAEMALREKTEELDRYFTRALDLLCIADTDGYFRRLNKEWEAALGYSTSELEGTQFLDYVHPEDIDATVRAVSRLASQEEVLNFVNRYRTKEGSYRWIEWRSFPSDKLIYAVARDITERKLIEEDLRQSEGRYRSLYQEFRGILNAIPDTLALLSSDLKVVWANEVAAANLNMSLDDFVGQHCYALRHGRSEPCVNCPAVECYSSHHPKIAESTLPDGRIWELHVYPVFDDSGQVKAVIELARNITERKRAEEETRRLRNYLSDIINSMPSMLVGVDRSGYVTQWNVAAENATGVKAVEAQGRPLEQVLPMLNNKLDRVRQAMQARTSEIEAKVARIVDGEMHYEDLTVYPLMGNGLEGAVIRVDDVTERVRMEEMMVQSEKMLSVGGLAAGMAHEINNPLGVILQASQNVIRRVSPDLPINAKVAGECGISLGSVRQYLERREILTFLEDIRQSGQRAAEIIANMLSFSRKSEGGGSSTDLAELLDRTVSLAASDYDLKKRYDFRQIEIVREYDSEVPLVVCHASKIQQVFLNILRNGAEAMRTGGEDSDRPPKLILRVAKDEDMVRVEIQDNGPGMDEVIRRRVFEPFFTTKSPGLGTGLGLSVSYFIVTEDHGGTMSVESSPGVGTRFIVRLPKGGKGL